MRQAALPRGTTAAPPEHRASPRLNHRPRLSRSDNPVQPHGGSDELTRGHETPAPGLIQRSPRRSRSDDPFPFQGTDASKRALTPRDSSAPPHRASDPVWQSSSVPQGRRGRAAPRTIRAPPFPAALGAGWRSLGAIVRRAKRSGRRPTRTKRARSVTSARHHASSIIRP